MENNIGMVNLVDDSKPKYKGILGTLKGIFADMKNPTRNGRLYSKECWKHALENDDVKEKLETRTMFGELDHPEERLETLQERAAIIVTKLELDERNGVVNGEAEILDTPFGRILKTFIDAGVKIGISSRGSGEETVSNRTEGNEIVPETFYLETFDIVALPAVKAARLSLVESKNKNIITEAFVKEIKEAKTEQQIKELQKYALDNGIHIEDNVINTLGGDNILPEKEEEDNIDVSSEVISQLEEELNVSNTKNKELESLCNMMKSHSVNMVKELKETRLVNEQLNNKFNEFITEKDELLNKVENYKLSNNYLKSMLEQKSNKANSLTESLNSKEEEASNLKIELENYKKQVNSLKMEKAVLEAKLRESERNYDKNSSYISDLKEDFNKVKEEKANLLKTNHQLEIKLEEVNKNNSKLIEEKDNELVNLKERVLKLDVELKESKAENSKLNNETKRLKEAYLKGRAKDNLINESQIKSSLKENFDIKDIDNKIDEALDVKNSLNNLSFNVGSLLTENVSIKAPEGKTGVNSTLKAMARTIQSQSK